MFQLSTVTIGGFELILGGDSFFELSDSGLYAALGGVFLVILSLIAIHRGIMALWFAFDGRFDREGINHENEGFEEPLTFSDDAWLYFKNPHN